MVTSSLKKTTAVWIILVLVLFVLAVIFGIAMRFSQGNDLSLSPVTFYTLMTTHGVTMVGIWFVAGLAGVHYLLARYVKVSARTSIFAMLLTVIGVVLLWVSTFVGSFHAAWTFLYPLPLHIVCWEQWSTPVFLLSLGIMGIGWMVWTVDLLAQILKKYSLTRAFGWQHLKKNPDFETPPFIMITTVTLIGIITCLFSAVLLLVLYFAEYFSDGSFTNDPLLMKNLTYFFGHTIINEALYLGLAALYELFPEVSGRPKFKNTWYVTLAWNCTMVFILTAFFHHLYMDFVQPVGFQFVGQIASYFSSLPAATVTAFSIIVVVFKNRIQWSIINLLFFIGVMGWLIGGVGAVIDATISNNFILHNTLWVPAHFHTYNALGNVLFSLAFFSWAANEFSNNHERNKYDMIKIILLLVGGVGFVLMFYLGGADSVPRRFSMYPPEFTSAALWASAGAWFAIAYLLAILLMLFNIVRKCIKVFSPAS
mgnify:FL=1